MGSNAFMGKREFEDSLIYHPKLVGVNKNEEMKNLKENVIRTMRNFSTTPNWNAVLSVEEVDYWLENYSDLIFCNGHGRKVVFDKITDKNFKVYTRPI